MFFILLCLLLWALFALRSPFDTFGWLMIVGYAWVAGYLDCRMMAKSDQDRAYTMPRDASPDDDGSDNELFAA